MNKLAGSTSPYLLQHADNPVEWYPWGPEALARAERERKPILLSIGYSACHWCHVMAHESFESADIARVMNAHFVNIKVDREERPDLDRIYQTAHQLLTRNRGGWPLTMFLSPDDRLPFFGGTYFPPTARHGLPGFADLLERVAAAYQEHPDQIAAYTQELQTALTQVLRGSAPAADIDPGLVDQACGQLNESFDATHGGFGPAPKFPHPSGLELLLDAADCTADVAARNHLTEVVDYTLEAMARGGINDHVGGGFCRYAVDDTWTIPHFEKMLYDNGPLLGLYAERAARTGNVLFHDAAAGIVDWLLGTMRAPEGGFYSSQDADSEGVEGRYYVWTRDEIDTVLGPAAAAFTAQYGVDGPANFEGRWHLRLPAPRPDAVAPDLAGQQSSRRRLRDKRAERVAPAIDEKVLTAWNALAIRGFAIAAQRLGRTDCLDAASSAADFLHRVHWRDGRLLATSRAGGARLAAYLDDYALLLDALLTLLAVRWRDADFEFAVALADTLLDHFQDSARGGFFFTADDHEQLLERPRTFTDDALPAGNGVAARALIELAHLSAEQRYLHAAEQTLRAGMNEGKRHPAAAAALAGAVLEHTMPPPRAILRVRDPSAVAAWLDAAAECGSARLRCYAIPASAVRPEHAPEALEGAAVTAYLCTGFSCQPPLTELDDFREALRH